MYLFARAFVSLRDKARSGMADRYPCLGPMERGQIPSWEASKREILLCAVLSLNKTFIQWESIKTIIWGRGGGEQRLK